MKMFRKEEGFTLVELMVVVLIIGILVAIAIPVFNLARASAQKRTCQANLRTLDGATQQWVADSTDNVGTAVTKADLEGKYVATWPKCPAATDNVYTSPTGQEYWQCTDTAHSYR